MNRLPKNLIKGKRQTFIGTFDKFVIEEPEKYKHDDKIHQLDVRIKLKNIKILSTNTPVHFVDSTIPFGKPLRQQGMPELHERIIFKANILETNKHKLYCLGNPIGYRYATRDHFNFNANNKIRKPAFWGYDNNHQIRLESGACLVGEIAKYYPYEHKRLCGNGKFTTQDLLSLKPYIAEYQKHLQKALTFNHIYSFLFNRVLGNKQKIRCEFDPIDGQKVTYYEVGSDKALSLDDITQIIQDTITKDRKKLNYQEFMILYKWPKYANNNFAQLDNSILGLIYEKGLPKHKDKKEEGKKQHA